MSLWALKFQTQEGKQGCSDSWRRTAVSDFIWTGFRTECIRTRRKSKEKERERIRVRVVNKKCIFRKCHCSSQSSSKGEKHKSKFITYFNSPYITCEERCITQLCSFWIIAASDGIPWFHIHGTVLNPFNLKKKLLLKKMKWNEFFLWICLWEVLPLGYSY